MNNPDLQTIDAIANVFFIEQGLRQLKAPKINTIFLIFSRSLD